MLRLFDASGRAPEPVDPPESIYDAIRWPAAPEDRPYVALNMVTTVDGKATLLRGRHRRPIGSAVDRALMVRLRAWVGAVVRGAGTVRQAPYYPSLPEGVPDRRRQAGLDPLPLVVILSSSGSLPTEVPLFRQAPRRPVVFTGPGAAPETLRRLREVADVLPVPVTGPDSIRWVLRTLRSRWGVQAVLSEGGPTLNSAFFRAGCVDELFWTVAPRIAGTSDDLSLVEGQGLIDPMPTLRLQSAHLHEDELYLRYRVLP
ncbi:dihydrofolate reductase family protein [Carboxydochorda subterranea]|uniref:Dihydrofolate reductase family protein n=1 Tax=Carboxydichorda subterranea TaxID=3109565 RepID=A0ABZ1BZ91_9FIRM|nr:dihydrofolate reductase family protein [Limnochorda sp. L945t]WRP17821.1 dihydrofolate reductase family protein [Limnochorda sp. L945t]